MEKEKRRKMKLDEGRRDPESVINELMEQADLDKATHEDAESELDSFGSRRRLVECHYSFFLCNGV